MSSDGVRPHEPTKMDKTICPALHYGKIAACRFCSLQPGGPSALCLKMEKAWRIAQERKRKELGAQTE